MPHATKPRRPFQVMLSSADGLHEDFVGGEESASRITVAVSDYTPVGPVALNDRLWPQGEVNGCPLTRPLLGGNADSLYSL